MMLCTFTTTWFSENPVTQTCGGGDFFLTKEWVEGLTEYLILFIGEKISQPFPNLALLSMCARVWGRRCVCVWVCVRART